MAELQGLPHCQPLEKRCRIVPWIEAWTFTAALHRGWLRWAADAASADTLNLQSFQDRAERLSAAIIYASVFCKNVKQCGRNLF